MVETAIFPQRNPRIARRTNLYPVSSSPYQSPHHQSPQRYRARRGSFKAPTFATSEGVSIDVGFTQSEAGGHRQDLPSSRWIDGPIFPKRLDLFRWLVSLDALAPCRQQSLKVGETANISARPDVVKEAAINPIARRSMRQKILEIQRRTWPDRGTFPVRQIVQCDSFGEGSAPNASFGGDESRYRKTRFR
jgi:hypothetical protein